MVLEYNSTGSPQRVIELLNNDLTLPARSSATFSILHMVGGKIAMPTSGPIMSLEIKLHFKRMHVCAFYAIARCVMN